MWTWIGKVLCVATVCAIFLGFGVLMGAKRPAESPQRFISTGKPGFAFDTKLGQECDMDGADVKLPPGFTLDIPRCATLAQR